MFSVRISKATILKSCVADGDLGGGLELTWLRATRSKHKPAGSRWRVFLCNERGRQLRRPLLIVLEGVFQKLDVAVSLVG
jgi:hypothetical protein